MRSVTKWLPSFCLAALCAAALSPAAQAQAVPGLSLSRSYMSFGDLCVGKTAGPLCFTITNTGGAPLVISSIGFINCSSSVDSHYIDCAAIAGFQISSGGSPSTLPPGGSQTVCVTFTPHEAATFSGFVQILSNAPTGPAIVELHGTGDACGPQQVTLSRS